MPNPYRLAKEYNQPVQRVSSSVPAANSSVPAKSLISRFVETQPFIPGKHWGIDLAGPAGSYVTAPVKLQVVQTGFDPRGYGNYVFAKDPATGYQLRFGHFEDYTVRVGDILNPGQVIGREGSTGNSSGPHLHFEVRTDQGVPTPPDLYLAKEGVSLPTLFGGSSWISYTPTNPAVSISSTSPGAVSPSPSSPRISVSPVQSVAASAPVQTGETPPPSQPRAVPNSATAAGQLTQTTGSPSVPVSNSVASLNPLQPAYDFFGKIKWGNIGYVAAGVVLILLGILVLIFSFKSEIVSTATKAVVGG